MKVCTDSCLFGALIDVNHDGDILDIGTGTGLLSLMVAQRTTNRIIALEPDENAFEQASDNVNNSPFRNITVIKQSLQIYGVQSKLEFNLIVCNPPFYSDYLKSPDNRYNSSTHTDSLPFNDLLSSLKNLLAPEGYFWLLLPTYQFEKFRVLAEIEGLYLKQKFEVYDRPNSEPIRNIGVFSYIKSIINISKIYIKSGNNEYTDQFRTLLSEYYKIF